MSVISNSGDEDQSSNSSIQKGLKTIPDCTDQLADFPYETNIE